MRLAILVGAFILSLAQLAFSQTQVTIGSTTATMNGCPPGSFLDGTIVAGSFHCSPAPSGGGAIVTGCGLSGIGTTGSPVSLNVGLKTVPSSPGNLPAAWNCGDWSLSSATPQAVVLPAAGSPGFTWPFQFCFVVDGTGAWSFTGAVVRDGPATFIHAQSGCIGVNDQIPASWVVQNWTPFATYNGVPSN